VIKKENLRGGGGEQTDWDGKSNSRVLGNSYSSQGVRDRPEKRKSKVKSSVVNSRARKRKTKLAP